MKKAKILVSTAEMTMYLAIYTILSAISSPIIAIVVLVIFFPLDVVFSRKYVQACAMVSARLRQRIS